MRFDLILEGHANNTVVNNVVRKDTTRYNLLKTYEDLFTDRDNKLRQGISSENIRKLRTNAGDKDDSNPKEVTLASIHSTKYCIPIDHPILEDHGVFYPWALSNHLCFEITFAPVDNVVIYSDPTKPPNYKITNLELEYRFPVNILQNKQLKDIKSAVVSCMKILFSTKHSIFRKPPKPLLMNT